MWRWALELRPAAEACVPGASEPEGREKGNLEVRGHFSYTRGGAGAYLLPPSGKDLKRRRKDRSPGLLHPITMKDYWNENGPACSSELETITFYPSW